VRESTGQQGNFFSPMGEREEAPKRSGLGPASSPANVGLGSGIVSGVYGLGCTSLSEREREREREREKMRGRVLWMMRERDLIWCFSSYLSWCMANFDWQAQKTSLHRLEVIYFFFCFFGGVGNCRDFSKSSPQTS
jgi:hypothetical protein